MTSSQWHFLPRVEVDGELMSMKKLSPKNFDQGTAFFINNMLFGLAQCIIFTKFEHTIDLDTKGLSSGMGDGLRWMT